jgi:aminopeptidase N
VVVVALALGSCSSSGGTGEARTRQTGALPARTCPRPPDYAEPNASRPRYSLSLTVDPDAGRVEGHLRVTFAPDRPTDRLVFRLWPNGPLHAGAGAHLGVAAVKLDGAPARTEMPDPTTLRVAVGRRLRAGEHVTAAMRWFLELPGPVLDRISSSGAAVRLGSFFPVLAWVEGRGWVLDPPTTALGETSTTPTADFDVRIDVPRGTTALATGEEVASGRWRATAVRDFAVAVGVFDKTSGIAHAPDPVRVTIGVEEQAAASGTAFLRKTVTALEALAERYGPYPWPTFSLAVMDSLGRAGIEYPTLVFQGEDSLHWATTHEVAHSWFYALVGNNQARDPWLDETLATWGQGRSERAVAEVAEVAVPADAAGRLGRAMGYWEDHEDSYFEGVYAQGVRALHALGAPAKVDCALRHYVARNAYGVAVPSDLIDALAHAVPHARRVLARFGAVP